MDNERSQRRFESVFSKKVRAGKRRTYFFDVRKTKGEDYYLTLTESTKKFNGEGYERHKIFLYKEDFNRFVSCLEEVVDHIKTELMPDYDYDEYTRRHEEYEERRRNGEFETSHDNHQETAFQTSEVVEETEDVASPLESEEDMSW